MGGGSRPQRHRALQSVLGEATAFHQPGPGCAARLRNKQPLRVCIYDTVYVRVEACLQ